MKKSLYKKGQKVKVNPNNDNENYDSFKNEILIITNVATNEKEHPGFDNSLEGESLYDFVTKSGKQVPFSLYDYELIEA